MSPDRAHEFTPDPQTAARWAAYHRRSARNRAWFDAHRDELKAQARGRLVAVAGEEAFFDDGAVDAETLARAAHPDDDGIVLAFFLPDPPPNARIFTPFFRGVGLPPPRLEISDE